MASQLALTAARARALPLVFLPTPDYAWLVATAPTNVQLGLPHGLCHTSASPDGLLLMRPQHGTGPVHAVLDAAWAPDATPWERLAAAGVHDALGLVFMAMAILNGSNAQSLTQYGAIQRWGG